MVDLPVPDKKDVREIDTSKATAARMYDFWLGGTHNYEADRNLARRILAENTIMRDLARQNRAFLQRCVRYLVRDLGVRQLVDLGSGVPTQGNVHEIAQDVAPDCRVVYVDSDIEAVVASREMLADKKNAAFIHANALNPDVILEAPETQRLIDFTEPVGLLMVALLHFVGPDKQPTEIIRRYLDRMPSGSVFAASHIGQDEASEEARRQVDVIEREYGSSANPVVVRTRGEFTTFFDGFDLVPPGVAYCADWRATEPVPVDDLARPCLYAAVALKP
jgi:hypothetical protein